MNAIQQYFSLMQPDSYFFIGNIITNEKQYFKAKDIVKLDFSGKTNVFFTPNSLGYRYNREKKKSFINRDRNHLDKLCCLYVDIDLKDAEDDNITADSFMEYANYHILGSEIPEPTMINNSGNGIHMYWAINPISYRGNLEKWKAMQEYIYSLFKRFGADHKVAIDNVRLLRVPDTINKKDVGITRARNISFSGKIYNLFELMQEYDVRETKILEFKPQKGNTEKTYNNISRVIPYPSNVFSTLYNKRSKDLAELLINYRDYEGSGRECILFLYRYYQCHISQDTQKALESTLELNRRLSYPLPIEEVKKATRSAEKYYKGNQLNWKNSKIIDFLSIKENEMGSMRTLINHAVKKERKKKRNRRYYLTKLGQQGKLIKKDEVILRQQSLCMLLQEGKDRYEICRILNISKSTYYNDKKAIETEEWQRNIKGETELAEPDELLQTGTDCIGPKMMPKNGHFSLIPKKSAPVISGCCVYTAPSGREITSNHKNISYPIRGKPV